MNTSGMIIALCSAITFASGAFAAVEKTDEKTGKRSSIEQVYNEKLGGRLVRPGTGKGVTGFVNVGGAVERSEIDRVIGTISKMFAHQQKVLEMKSLSGLPTQKTVEKLGLNVGVFIVSDEKLPPMLVAPEERWALVNVAKLKEGLKDDAAGIALYRVRCRGELQRAFCYAAGCGSSQYENNLMDVVSVDQIETVKSDVMVADAVMRCRKYLATVGVTQPVITTYLNACQEGWAAAPTNDAQKAIWDKVHALPTKPIKITYDPAKGE